jgi:type 1 fimbria pilin
MKVHTLDIDSGERDTNVYSYANNYTVTLKEPIYDVTQVKLISARIPTPQLTTCITNKTFSIHDSGAPDDIIEVTLDETNYTNGTALASDLDTKMQPPLTCIDSVVFDSDTQALTFSNTEASNTFTFKFFDGTNGYLSNTYATTPHQVMGFSSKNPTISDTVISGAINLEGPNSLILRMTSGSDEFTKTVYSTTPFYTGHILMNGTDYLNYHHADDPLTHEFYKGPQKYIKYIKLEFFYMSHGRLIPYDFRNQDHILKFEITGSTDKLEGLPKVPEEAVKDDAPKLQINIPEVVEDVYKWKMEYVSIGLIIFVGIVLLSLMHKRPKLSE